MMEKSGHNLLVEVPFAECSTGGSLAIVIDFWRSGLVIFINAFFNHSFMYSRMGETIFSCLILASNNSFSISLKLKLS
jgi:hypothetical protein